MLISYTCFNCETKQYEEDPFVGDQNNSKWYFKCRCPNCNYKNTVEVDKPLQILIDFKPFNLN